LKNIFCSFDLRLSLLLGLPALMGSIVGAGLAINWFLPPETVPAHGLAAILPWLAVKNG
jgi:hypothetical protein